MVKIRLSRVGSKNQAKYRIVAVDERGKRDGKFLEILGTYDPTVKEAVIVVKRDRVDFWVSQGAQPSDAIKRILAKGA